LADTATLPAVTVDRVVAVTLPLPPVSVVVIVAWPIAHASDKACCIDGGTPGAFDANDNVAPAAFATERAGSYGGDDRETLRGK
jgi:hypothetical protein